MNEKNKFSSRILKHDEFDVVIKCVIHNVTQFQIQIYTFTFFTGQKIDKGGKTLRGKSANTERFSEIF